MPRYIEPIDPDLTEPDKLPDGSDLSKIYERTPVSPSSHEVNPTLPHRYLDTLGKYKRFIIGAKLSAAPIVLFSIYLFLRGNGLDTLLVFLSVYLLVILASLWLSYTTLKELSYNFALVQFAFEKFIVVCALLVCSSIKITYVALVFFSLPYGYVILPLCSTLISGYLFTIVLKFALNRDAKKHTALYLYGICAAVCSIALILH